MSTPRFTDLELSAPVLRALDDCGYETPTPIQLAAIPIVTAGHDLIGTAQTGTGKTAAFTLPIIERLTKREPRKGDTPRALVLTPTRELALQIEENIREYGRHVGVRTCVLLGGVPSEPQIRKLKAGVDILVATPGRLIDIMKQGHAKLGKVEVFVLDEADRMLDMGFIHDVRWVESEMPKERQTLLFSATMSAAVRSLASTMQTDAQTVSVAPPATVADNIEQQVMFVEKADKRELLVDLLKDSSAERILVFTRTKQSATLIAGFLDQRGIRAEAIHSNKSQSQRQRALDSFSKGKMRVLVATDIVARGIDVEGISHVINFELPEDSEAYVHRIGRTARAGRAGVAVSLCGLEDVSLLRGVENLTRTPLIIIEDQRFHSPNIAACREAADRAARGRARAGRGRGSGSKWAR